MTTQTQPQEIQKKMGYILESIFRNDFGFSDCYDASLELTKSKQVIFGNPKAGTEEDVHQEFFSKFPFVTYNPKFGFNVSEASVDWEAFLTSKELQDYVATQKKKFKEQYEEASIEKEKSLQKYQTHWESTNAEIAGKRKTLRLAMANEMISGKKVLQEMWEEEKPFISQKIYIVLLQLLAKGELYFENKQAGSIVMDAFSEFFEKYSVVQYTSKVGPHASFAKIEWETPIPFGESDELKAYAEKKYANYIERENENNDYLQRNKEEIENDYKEIVHNITKKVNVLATTINSVGLNYDEM